MLMWPRGRERLGFGTLCRYAGASSATAGYYAAMALRSADTRTALVGARLAWGAVLLVSPERVLAETPDRVPGYVRSTVRVLGARHLVEGAVLARHARRPPPGWSIAVDALHGLSMLALASARPDLRRDALRSAAAALGLAALSAYER